MAIHPLRRDSRPALEIGFLSEHNPFDRRSFSGTTHFSARALSERPEINLRILGPHRPPRLMDRVLNRKAPRCDADLVDVHGLDAVVGLVATPLLDRLTDLHPGLPMIHVTDATPAFLREFYGWQVGAEADAAETRVARKAAHVVYSSSLMADRAAGDLGLPGFEAKSALFGVNIETLPEICPPKEPLDRIRLLFVGIDWERKGGDIAVATLDSLTARGLDATLTVVGRCPERHRRHPRIVDAGFLNKNRPKDAARLIELYRQAHFLLLPSRADCTPMVVSEAMAHGTPVLATDTGGIRDLVGGPATGRLLPPFSPPDAWARAIAGIAIDPMQYGFMSDACFDRSRNALSWQNWARQIEILVRRSLGQDERRKHALRTAVGT